MISSIGFLAWHLVLAMLVLLIHRLSVRLGKALADNERFLPLYWIGAILVLGGGIVLALPQESWRHARLAGALLDLAGASCAALAGWRYWGWLPGEIRRNRKKG